MIGIWFGLSRAEFVLPLLTVFLLSIYSWRSIWQFISILILFLLPLIIYYYTIKNISIDSRELRNQDSNNSINTKKLEKIEEVLKDLKFYIISKYAFNALGLLREFCYQSFLAEAKFWGFMLFLNRL